MNLDPEAHVTIEADVGYTGLKEYFNPSPEGRTKEVYTYAGWAMDARAKKVRDELIKRGIAPERICTSRGEAHRGGEWRKVEFLFSHPESQ